MQDDVLKRIERGVIPALTAVTIEQEVCAQGEDLLNWDYGIVILPCNDPAEQPERSSVR